VRPQQQRHHEVDGQPDQRDDDHRHTRNSRRGTEPAERLGQDERPHPDQQHRVGNGGEHFGAVPTIGSGR
jgi:hypothetical protein